MVWQSDSVNRRGFKAGAAGIALMLAFATACSSGAAAKSSKIVLNWYLPAGRIDAQALASSCSTDKYDIKVRQLPAEADERRTELVRRLTGKDTSIDLIGLDTALTAEFAAAKLLAPVPDDLEPTLTEKVFESALKASTFEGDLVSIPWWFEPQVLWFRAAAAERAGLDMSESVTWDALIDGARGAGTTIEIENPGQTGIADWVSGLVGASGGAVVAGASRDAKVGIDSDAGREAASVVERYQQARVGGGPTDEALKSFAGPQGGFLLASPSAISDPDVINVASDMKWAQWPTVGTSTESIPPLQGRALAVPLYAPHSPLSFNAIGCLTSPQAMSSIMLTSGHSSARSSTYELDQVKSGYPMADTTTAGLKGGAAVPATPYWSQISAGIGGTWSPLSTVTTTDTPGRSQHVVEALLAGALP